MKQNYDLSRNLPVDQTKKKCNFIFFLLCIYVRNLCEIKLSFNCFLVIQTKQL